MFCLQGKLQKHQAFEAEVQANSGAIVKLDETGNQMINEGHFASETIRVSLKTFFFLQTFSRTVLVGYVHNSVFQNTF